MVVLWHLRRPVQKWLHRFHHDRFRWITGFEHSPNRSLFRASCESTNQLRNDSSTGVRTSEQRTYPTTNPCRIIRSPYYEARRTALAEMHGPASGVSSDFPAQVSCSRCQPLSHSPDFNRFTPATQPSLAFDKLLEALLTVCI